MDLSIIIVSWNAKKHLLECLQSVISDSKQLQTEIIVVDNASTDGSPDGVKKQFPGVKLICNDKNMGFARANNIGIKASTGRYICLINSDVKVLNGCFDRLYGFMEQTPSVGMAGPRTLNSDLTLQSNCRTFPALHDVFTRTFALDKLLPHARFLNREITSFCPENSASMVDVITGIFWMIRREALNQVGLLDEQFFFYGEDTDWCRRFWKASWKIAYFPKAEVIHFGGASSSNAPVRFYVELQKANFQYWKKHHSKPELFCFLLLSVIHQTMRIIGESAIYMVQPADRRRVREKIERSVSAIRWLLGKEISTNS